MFNDRLDRVGDYPFDRLRALLGPIEPRAGMTPIALSLGEPHHAPPTIIRETVDANAQLWGRYPPMKGTEDARNAIAEWLARRYGLPDGMIDAERNIVPVSGTREALFLIALAVVPEQKAGRRPVVLMPNPFYQVYAGAAVLAGAEPVFLPAALDTGFLPDLEAVPEDTLARTALAYYCSPANPQGAIAGR
jgi:aspartate/methionine/tyrosine aminotransferase